MRRTGIMLVAGEASGDANAADLVRALALAVPAAQFQITSDVQPLTTPLAPSFFGAGGPKMAAAGVEIEFDLTAHSAIGLGFITRLPSFLRMLFRLVRLAAQRQPEVIIFVDYGGFNLRLAHAIRSYIRARTGSFFNWKPKFVGFTSPQVWASRPWRAKTIARNYDLVLSLFPFEKAWYAGHVPQLPVEFVGNPIFDRYPEPRGEKMPAGHDSREPIVVLLPGSRRGELKRHVRVMQRAAGLIAARQPAQFKMVVPEETLAGLARTLLATGQPKIELQVAGLEEALSSATMAITKSGTVALDCAYFGVPAVAMYKINGFAYPLARYFATVKYLSMPNLLADEAIYPEFIQGGATVANIAEAALALLANPARCDQIREKLDVIIQSLGGPGAARRAAAVIVKLLQAR